MSEEKKWDWREELKKTLPPLYQYNGKEWYPHDKLIDFIAKVESQALQRAKERVIPLLKKQKIRLEILRDRMNGCQEDHGKTHELSLIEIPGWIDELSDALRAIGGEE